MATFFRAVKVSKGLFEIQLGRIQKPLQMVALLGPIVDFKGVSLKILFECQKDLKKP